MERSLEVKIQFFAGQITARIIELEAGLLIGQNILEERKLMAQSEILQEMLDRYEDIFAHVLHED
jgi:hypothetical protein